MKRCLLWIKLCVMACILGFSSGAKAQSYQADENEPLITVVSPTVKPSSRATVLGSPQRGTTTIFPRTMRRITTQETTSVRLSTAIFPLIGIPIPQE